MRKTLTFYSLLFIFFLILQRGAGILNKILLANYVTLYEYSLITMVAISLPAMLQLITNLNFYSILSHSKEGKKYFGFTIICTLFMSTTTAILLYLFSDYFFSYLNLPPEYWNLFYIIILISLFSSSLIIDIQGFFTGMRQYALPGIIMAMPSLIRFAIIILLILLNAVNFHVILFVFAISNALPLLYILISKDRRHCLRESITIQLPTKKILAFGTSIFIVSSFSLIGQYLIRIVVIHDLGVIWQGYYDVSLTLASIILLSLSTMSYLSIPEATSGDADSLEKCGGLGDVTRSMFASMALILIILFFYADFIVVTLFSDEYLPASQYVIILGIGFVFLFVQTFIANINLSRAKKGREFLLISIATLALIPAFFYLTKFLISYFGQIAGNEGFIGAYISYTVIIIAFTGITILCVQDTSPLIIITRKLGNLLLSVAITVLIIYFIGFEPMIGIPLTILFFSVLVFLTGYLNKNQFMHIIARK